MSGTKFCSFPLLFLLWMYIHEVCMQSLDVTLETCLTKVELRCVFSGSSNCCSANTRVWKINNTPVMSNGVSSSAKYEEKIDTDLNYFALIINNPEDSADFNMKYTCEYGFLISEGYTMKKNDCNCVDCAGTCFGFSLIVVVVAEIVFVAIVASLCAMGYLKKKTMIEMETKVNVIIGVAAGVSVCVNLILTLVIGSLLCVCFLNHMPFFILCGILVAFATYLVAGAIFFKCHTTEPPFLLFLFWIAALRNIIGIFLLLKDYWRIRKEVCDDESKPAEASNRKM